MINVKNDLFRFLPYRSKYNGYLTLVLFLNLLFTNRLFGQIDSVVFSTENVLDEILQESEVEDENENIFELIEELSRSPIDLNSASLNELLIIPGLNLFFANLIIEHRKKYGNFFSKNELNLINDLPKEIIEKIKPFVTVRNLKKEEYENQESVSNSSIDNFMLQSKINVRSRIVNELQNRRGFLENKYEGSRPKIYNRFLFSYKNYFDAAFVTEKDAGEKSINDFTSFHFALKDYDLIKLLVVGDYTLNFGQGLALWSPFAFSKGSDAIYPAKRKGKFINPFKSTFENYFFRGTAVTIQLNDLLFSSFYSNNFLDANIDSTTANILSTPLDGYHRTESEKRKRKSAKEIAYGFSTELRSLKKNYSAGILYYSTKFNSPFAFQTSNKLSGDNFSYISLYFDFYFDRLNFFGESSFDEKSIASLVGLSINVSKNFSILTSFRNYPSVYKNVHGYAFGENSGAASNEVGFYTGFSLNTILGEINFYYDQFKFPFATFNNPIPSTGNDILFDLKSKPFERIETNFRFKRKTKEVSQAQENIKQLVWETKQNFRGEITHHVSRKLRLKSRLEFTNYSLNKIKDETGFVVFQDIRFAPTSNLSIDARLIFFQTDSYNSAVFEYENDLRGMFSNTALYGKGTRWYILFRYELFDFIFISTKYSETYKPLERTLSTGLSEIQNNIDNKISFQVEIRN